MELTGTKGLRDEGTRGMSARRDAPRFAVDGSLPTGRELELGAIIDAYNEVTEKLKGSHEVLTHEIRRLHQQLEEKDRELERRNRLAALGEMAAGVAHEIRNPLGGILLYATMLMDDLKDEPETRRLAEQITSAVHSLDGIVGDILVFSNPQEPNRQPVDLDGLVGDVIDLLQPRWTDVGCWVGKLGGDEVVVGFGEASQIQRAVLNVVSNAIDAAGRSGHVWISLGGMKNDGEFVEISVADDGPGIPESLGDRIFNPFFTTKDSGTGLGLAIVHRIVESHGGHVRVSGRPGGGSVFTLSLPAMEGSS